MGRGAGAELGGTQGLPLAAGTQDEENGIHTHAVGGAWPAAAKAVGIHVLGDQPFDLRPQIIGNAPVFRNMGIAHGRVQPIDAAVRK